MYSRNKYSMTIDNFNRWLKLVWALKTVLIYILLHLKASIIFIFDAIKLIVRAILLVELTTYERRKRQDAAHFNLNLTQYASIQRM